MQRVARHLGELFDKTRVFFVCGSRDFAQGFFHAFGQAVGSLAAGGRHVYVPIQVLGVAIEKFPQQKTDDGRFSSARASRDNQVLSCSAGDDFGLAVIELDGTPFTQ